MEEDSLDSRRKHLSKDATSNLRAEDARLGTPQSVAIRKHAERLLQEHSLAIAKLSAVIYARPEPAFEEHFACAEILALVERSAPKVGRQVQRNYCGVATALRVDVQSVHYRPEQHATVAFVAEYDALPDLGHACGHNLISEASVGAFLIVADLIDRGLVNGRAVLVGTPEKESQWRLPSGGVQNVRTEYRLTNTYTAGCGKGFLLNRGGLDDIDAALMAHPFNMDAITGGTTNGPLTRITIHAHNTDDLSPWQSVNALDACVSAYVQLAMLRVSAFNPRTRLLMTIEQCHSAKRCITMLPQRATLTYQLHSPFTAMENDNAQVLACVRAVAKGANCTLELHSDSTMSAIQRHFGVKIVACGNVFSAYFNIYKGDCGEGLRTEEFARQAGSAEAQVATKRALLGLALCAADVLIAGVEKDVTGGGLKMSDEGE